MILCIGGAYRTRNKALVKIVYQDLEDDHYPMRGDNGEWYSLEGKSNKYSKNNLDLIEKVMPNE